MGKREKRCYCGIGGQAVLEGVMMKNQDSYAVAVRRPDGEIELKKKIIKESGAIRRSRRFLFYAVYLIL